MADTPSPSPAPNGKSDWLSPLALILALVAFATAGFIFWNMQNRIQDLELQLAKRIGATDTSSKEALDNVQAMRTTIDQLNTRTAALEAKSQETQNQQLALGAMYQELTRGQDERLLADIGQMLNQADEQLEVAGNVRAAVLGLDAAEARLSRMKKPQFERLRAAISRDAAKLKLLPAADIVGINARLDALLQNIDRLKLESDREEPAKPQPVQGTQATDRMEQLGLEAWSEFKQLVRIRRIDQPEAPLLEPSQTYFLRQNLRLRLLSARLAVLQRDQATFRADIVASRKWVARYFNPNDPLTQSFEHDLDELSKMPVSIENVNLNDSLGVLNSLNAMVH